MFKTLNDAKNWIESIKRFGDKLDLSRMEKACEMLNQPQNNFKSIHIGGTNGKGSTLTYLKNILLKAGYNVGTYTSPFIVRFNERITYNNEEITDDEFLYYINKIYMLHNEYLKKYNDQITFFELITLSSFLYFSDKEVDYVLYEVGLGGRLDATNVITPELSIITTISYDHMNVLGSTLEEIALNKLGIVKENIPLVTGVTQEELKDLFVNYTNKKNSEIYFMNHEDIYDITYNEHLNFTYLENKYKLNMLGIHQSHNAALAVLASLVMMSKGLITLSHENIVEGLLESRWPGRMEKFGNIIIDGAHNTGGLEALKETMITHFKDKKIKSIFTVMADKESFDMIKILETFVDEVYFTEFDYDRCESAEILYGLSEHPKKHLDKDVFKLVESLKDVKDDEILLITGSLYFISLIRQILTK